jgi:enoyl-CoA hydratase/carnithine racemase
MHNMSEHCCQVESHDRVLVVTITRPERRNALDRAANFELGQVFDTFEQDHAHRVAVLTGVGDKAFCAGADLRSGDEPRGPEDATPPTGFGGLIARFGRTKPVIAAVNGVAAGGGFELALACDLIIASELASFGLTEPRVGLAAMGGGVPRLIREIGPKRAHALLLTGRLISAGEGWRLGFVNEVVSHDDLLSAALRWAAEILACSPASIRATKEMADTADGQRLEASIAGMFELPAVKALLASPDAREGPRAFAERRTPQWSEL